MMRKIAFLGLLGASWGALAAPIEIGDIPACTALTPAAISLDNTPVTLDVRVLLDGVAQPSAEQIMSRAADSFAPLGITMVSSYETVGFSGLDAAGLIDQAKSYYGGVRPDGIDIVYVLTDKDLNTLAGLADCIGGVKYADRAFAVGEAWEGQPLNLLLYKLNTEKAAKTTAHEIGHLMGAHHHQANCVESLLNFGEVPCTLMFNFVDIQNTDFSLLNSVVVRGHGQLYATP